LRKKEVLNIKRKKEKKPPVNYKIRSNNVLVIDENKKKLGIMPRDDAVKLAKERGLDLVAVNIEHIPPVCKILDYGKHLYTKHKQQKLARKKQRIIQIKELKFGPEISEHDYNVKIKHAREFLMDDKKVKLTVKFRGREIIYSDKGIKLLNKITEELQDISVCEKKPVSIGKVMYVMVAPKNISRQRGGNIAENKDKQGRTEKI